MKSKVKSNMEVNFERKIDGQGRVVLPLDMRRSLGLKKGDTVCIDVKDGQIILTSKEK